MEIGVSLSELLAFFEIARLARQLAKAAEIDHLRAFGRLTPPDVLLSHWRYEDLKSAVMQIMAISDEMFDVLYQRARDCHARHAQEVRQIAITGKSMEEIKTEAEDCMCGTLSEMKRQHHGRLPNDILDGWWVAYGCSD